MNAARAIRFRVFFVCFMAFAMAGAIAQTAIDDVHITPREKPVNIASAAYGTDTAARLARGGLIRANANLVLVPVTITDSHSRPIVGLGQNNFQLFDGKKPQEIKHFSSEDSPISVGILVDTSGSMSYKLDRAREAAAQFCEAANPQDEFFLITFADEPSVAADFTTRTEEIVNDLLTVRSKGQTSLLDAIYLGLRKMRSARYARKALLILSDGGDNHSRYTERDLKAAVKESDVAIYSVGTFDRQVDTLEERLGPELLRSFAQITGGEAFTLNNANDMAIATRIIGAQLRHQYMLAYQPQFLAGDGRWRKIKVKLLLPKNFHTLLRVEARAGYYSGGE